MKLPSKTVTAERFDTHGRRIEDVMLTVNVPEPGTTVFLHIDNGVIPKDYSIPIEDWRELMTAVPEEGVSDEHAGHA
jgi:hypothetical protein